MATFKKFEEIVAWQKARIAVGAIYRLTSTGTFAKDFGLRDQIRRSAISIMANVAEGSGRTTDKEFANFLNIAHGSVTETQSHLYIATDLGYLSETDFATVYSLLDEVGRMTTALMKHLRT
jgi:four helix bundle protein